LDASRELLIFDVPGQVSLDSVPYSGRGHPLDAQSDAVIRWRVAADGSRESNARLVRWQDGSMDLMIGNEVLVGKLSDITDGLCYQYVRQDQAGSALLEAHTRLTRRLGVVPRTAGGAVPVRVARAVTARHTEQKKSEIKIFTAHQDPERDKREKELIEEQRIQVRSERRVVWLRLVLFCARCNMMKSNFFT
jgi:RNA polymerase-associated protein LEO1